MRLFDFAITKVENENLVAEEHGWGEYTKPWHLSGEGSSHA